MNYSAIYNFGGLRVLTTDNTQLYMEISAAKKIHVGYASHSVPTDQYHALRTFLGEALNPNGSNKQPIYEVEGFALRLFYEDGSRWPHPDYKLRVTIGEETLEFGHLVAVEVLKAIHTCCDLGAMSKALSASMPIRTTTKKGGNPCTL